MTHEDQQALKLGKEVIRMIAELRDTARVQRCDRGYTRRMFTFRGGGVTMFLVNSEALADVLDKAAELEFSVTTLTPPSQVN